MTTGAAITDTAGAASAGAARYVTTRCVCSSSSAVTAVTTITGSASIPTNVATAGNTIAFHGSSQNSLCHHRCIVRIGVV
jgi:hypothetical protein